MNIKNKIPLRAVHKCVEGVMQELPPFVMNNCNVIRRFKRSDK